MILLGLSIWDFMLKSGRRLLEILNFEGNTVATFSFPAPLCRIQNSLAHNTPLKSLRAKRFTSVRSLLSTAVVNGK
jgi:hypothetical protein